MTPIPIPYKRWFFWLLFSVVLTLVNPYLLHHQGARFYDPSIGTFVQTSQGLVQTTEQVWIDGRTAAFLGATDWLYMGLLVIVAEATWWLVQAAFAKRRIPAASPTRPDQSLQPTTGAGGVRGELQPSHRPGSG